MSLISKDTQCLLELVEVFDVELFMDFVGVVIVVVVVCCFVFATLIPDKTDFVCIS